MTPQMRFSASACHYIAKMIAKDNAIGFRLSIKKTGCSGYSYLPAVIHKINPNDLVFTATDDLQIYIDPLWAHLLEGVHVDFIEEEKSGLKQKRLVFTNPNESSRCGCGESFHIASEEV